MQDAKNAAADLQQVYENTCREHKYVQECLSLATAHLLEHGQPFTNPDIAPEDGEYGLVDVEVSRAQQKKALDSFYKAETHWRSCNKKQAAVKASKVKGVGKGGPAERQAADTRRDALKRTQAHMKMLEEASQVL